MSAGRPKRQVTVPRKFPIEEGPFASLPLPLNTSLQPMTFRRLFAGYMLPDSPSKLQVRRVLRILKPPDLQRKLEDATVGVCVISVRSLSEWFQVYVVWPDDALWYEATIQEVSSSLFNSLDSRTLLDDGRRVICEAILYGYL